VLEEEGVVKEVMGRRALVMTERKGECAHCMARQTCHALEEGKEVLAQVLNPIGAEIGDRVKITVQEKNLLKSSFIIYFFPAVGVVMGSAIGYYTGKSFGWDTDLSAVVAGLFFLGFSFLLVSFFNRHLEERGKHWPQIREIVAHARADLLGQQPVFEEEGKGFTEDSPKAGGGREGKLFSSVKATTGDTYR
jgi:sigma-E factor negative regulatory protein RseC